MEELKEGIVKNKNEILCGKTTVVQNAIYFFSHKLFFFSGSFEPLKKEQIKIFNENLLKTCENLFWIINFSFIWWPKLLSNSSYDQHGTYYLIIAPRRSQKTTIIFFTFVTVVKLTSWCLLRSWSRHRVCRGTVSYNCIRRVVWHTLVPTKSWSCGLFVLSRWHWWHLWHYLQLLGWHFNAIIKLKITLKPR